MNALAYIGLGSNLNEPERQIKLALQALAQLPNSSLIVASSFYRTAPVGYLLQPDFINAVACLRTQSSPEDLLAQLQAIEFRQGRIRDGQKNRPRTLDLDLLLYNDWVLSSAQLTLPHPRMKERTFVLLPLVEIAPNLQIPPGISARQLLAGLVDQPLPPI